MASSTSSEIVPAAKYAALTYEGGVGELLDAIRLNIGKAQLSEWDLDRVKLPSGGGQTWEIPSLEGGSSTRELSGVIVHWKDTRSYWQTSFDSTGGGTPPDCASDDAVHAPITGNPGVAVPTDPETGMYICARCPNAQFGSAVRADGKDTNAQACRQSRILFLLTENDLLPFVVALPPTSVKTASQYFLRLARGGIPYYSVITSLALDVVTSGGNIKYSQARFKMAARLEGDHLARVRAYAEALAPIFARVSADAADFDGASETPAA